MTLEDLLVVFNQDFIGILQCDDLHELFTPEWREDEGFKIMDEDDPQLPISSEVVKMIHYVNGLLMIDVVDARKDQPDYCYIKVVKG